MPLATPHQAAAQFQYAPPDKFERATIADANGILQWAEHAQEKCTSCAGTGKTECTTCADFDDAVKVCPECKRTKNHEATCRACAGSRSVAPM